MCAYFNPPARLSEIGRRIRGESFTVLHRELRPGEVIVACFEKQVISAAIDPRTGVRTELGVSGPFEVAPLVRSQVELDDCVYKAGGESARFYAVPSDEAAKGTDQ